MNNEDFNYIPRSAARLRNRDISDQHKALLKTGNPASAADLIKNRPDLEAFSASLFNFIEQKLVFIEQQLSGKTEKFIMFSQTQNLPLKKWKASFSGIKNTKKGK